MLNSKLYFISFGLVAIILAGSACQNPGSSNAQAKHAHVENKKHDHKGHDHTGHDHKDHDHKHDGSCDHKVKVIKHKQVNGVPTRAIVIKRKTLRKEYGQGVCKGKVVRMAHRK